jgi:sugar lactone lactonase YvrE
MYVTDINYGYVSKLDLPTGAPLGGFATVFYPQGLAFDQAGNLYVALYYGNRIERFTPSGVRSVFTATGLSNPTTLAFDRAGNLYAANTRDGTIEKFTPNGGASVFASNLPNPYGMAFDTDDNMYVGLAGNNTIEKFTLGGERSVFADGGLIHSPCGLALDSAGTLYTVNGDDGTIIRFTEEGTASFFVSTTSHGRLNLAFDASDNLYVSNIGNNTIERFTREGTASVFATGLHDPEFFVIQQVPEPSVFALLSIVLLALVARGKGRRRLRVISANLSLHWTGSSRFCSVPVAASPAAAPGQ